MAAADGAKLFRFTGKSKCQRHEQRQYTRSHRVRLNAGFSHTVVRSLHLLTNFFLFVCFFFLMLVDTRVLIS